MKQVQSRGSASCGLAVSADAPIIHCENICLLHTLLHQQLCSFHLCFKSQECPSLFP